MSSNENYAKMGPTGSRDIQVDIFAYMLKTRCFHTLYKKIHSLLFNNFTIKLTTIFLLSEKIPKLCPVCKCRENEREFMEILFYFLQIQ